MPEHQAAIDYITPRLKERLERDGMAWFSPADSQELVTKFGMAPRGLGSLYKTIAKELGVKLDKRGSRPEALSFMMKVIKENANIINADVRKRFLEAYPDVGYAPMVYAAKVRLGLTTRSPNGTSPESNAAVPSTLFRDGEMRQVYNVLAQFEALQKKRIEIKRKLEDAQLELEDVDQKIAKYKLIAQSLDHLRASANRLKEEEERDAR